jgi:flagellar motor switch protein FliN/FliY
MSDLPTDDVEELEAIEVEDEEDEIEEDMPPPPSARQADERRQARREARAAASARSDEQAAASQGAGQPSAHSLEFLHDVEMEVTVELGRARRTVRDMLEVQVGSVIELDRAAGSPVDVLVNGRLIARGEVVVVDDEFAVRITEIFDSSGARTGR